MGRIKAACRDTATHVVTCSEEQNDVGRAVSPQILDSGDGCHCGIGSKVARVDVLRIEYLRAGPAVVDAQLGTKLCNHLHPPGFVHVGQQIVLGISGSVCQVKAVRLGNVAGKGRGACGQNRNDLVLVVSCLGMLCRAYGAAHAAPGVPDCRLEVVLVLVTARGAGVDRPAAMLAGCRDGERGVIMPRGIHVGVHVRVAARRAGVGGIALCRAGGWGDGGGIRMNVRLLNHNIVGQRSGKIKDLRFITVFEYKCDPTVLGNHSHRLIRPLRIREIAQIIAGILPGGHSTCPLEGGGIRKRNHRSGFEIQIVSGACSVLLIIPGSEFIAVNQFRFLLRCPLGRLVASDIGFHDLGNQLVAGCIRM